MDVAQTTNYTYDNANRMTYVNGVAYSWDSNGNMLSDGTSTYIYNHANQLISITSGSNVEAFSYNGEGDRLTETTNGAATTFTLDLNAGLTQVLSDGTNTYLYGLGRISQSTINNSSFFLGDALGSVRQLADGQGKETLAQWYEPYGDILVSAGDSKSMYGFTGEMQDSYIKLIFLRARYYKNTIGRFIQKDNWRGNYRKPITFNKWDYGMNNPVIETDPSGMFSTLDVIGMVSSSILNETYTVNYDYQAAVDYALEYSSNDNPEYPEFCSLLDPLSCDDCTSFGSQALKAGGFPEDDKWFYAGGTIGGILHPNGCNPNESTIYQAHCGEAWARSDLLYDYLTKDRGFEHKDIYDNGEVLPKSPDNIPEERFYGTAAGDIVFYKYEDNDIYRHVAVMVGWGPLTEAAKDKTRTDLPYTEPHIVDHSAATVQIQKFGPRSINDNSSDIIEISIVEIPKIIPILGGSKVCWG